MLSQAVITSPRSSGGTTIHVTSGPPGDLTFPATLAVVRAGAVITALTATAWAGSTITVTSAAAGFSDANLVVGDLISTSSVAYVPIAYLDSADSLGRLVSPVAGGGGSVTSVGLTVPSSILSVSGSPVTTSGTIATALMTQSANTIFAGPSSGSAAAPSFRALVATDIPAIAESGVTGLVSDLAAKAALTSPAFTGRISYPAHTSAWQALPAPSSGTITIPWGTGDRWYGTLPNTSVTFAYSGVPSAGQSQVLTLRLAQPASGAACTVTWPSGSVYPGGTAPALSSANGDVDAVVVSLDPSGSAYETTLVGANYH